MKHKRVWTALLAALLVFAPAVSAFAASAEEADAADEAFGEFFGMFYPMYMSTYLLSMLATVLGGALCAFVWLHLREKKKLENNRRFFGPEPQEVPQQYPQAPVAPVYPPYAGQNTQTPWGGMQP